MRRFTTKGTKDTKAHKGNGEGSGDEEKQNGGAAFSSIPNGVNGVWDRGK
jgi:hypothetical protein